MPSECSESASQLLSNLYLELISPFIPKKTSIKEIRQRGFQRKNDIKIGVRADQDIKFREIAAELNGNLYTIKEDVKSEPNSFIYFLDDYDIYILAKDKSFRKSCRPNCVVKLKRGENHLYHVIVYSIRNIGMNEELTLGFDYKNSFEKFTCICNDQNFCLLKTINK